MGVANSNLSVKINAYQFRTYHYSFFLLEI